VLDSLHAPAERVGGVVREYGDTLYSDDEHDYLVWKWQPIAEAVQ